MRDLGSCVCFFDTDCDSCFHARGEIERVFFAINSKHAVCFKTFVDSSCCVIFEII